MLELGMSFSMEQLVIDDDIIGMDRYACRGIEVDKDTIAYDSITDVGIGNNFLGTLETLRNVDLPSRPHILDRTMYETWVKNGSNDNVDDAHKRVMDILKNHEVEPIANRDLIENVIRKADERNKKFNHSAEIGM